MAERMANNLLDTSDISVTHLCTDSDATGRDAFAKVDMESSKSLPHLTWFKDPSHVSRNMKRHILDHNFNKDAFGTKQNGSEWIYKERLDCRKALALDIPERVSVTMQAAAKHYKDDLEKIKENAETLVTYIFKCYGGDHTSCCSVPLLN